MTWPSRSSSTSTDYASSSDKLLRVRLGIVDSARCNDGDTYDATLQLCAGNLAGDADTCQGDSGGPILSLRGAGDETTGVQVGLTSYGYGCAQAFSPGVYTRVSAFIGWLSRAVPDFPGA